jgi:FlaA1/EpsC-like NDP-sugar epimerase
MIFLTIVAFNALLGESKYPAAVLGLCWLFAVVAVPLARIIVRRLGSSFGIWGEPVVIIGNGNLSTKIIHYLLKNTACGLTPVLVVDGFTHGLADSAAKDLPIPIIPFEKWPSAP